METITGNVSAALLSNGQGFHVLGVGVSTGAGEGKTFANVVGAGLNIRVGEQQVAAVIPSTTHHWRILERQRLYTATARDKQRVVLVADDRALRRAEFHLSGRRRETTRSLHQLTLRNGALQMKKTLVNAAAAVALLACATAQAARFTDNSLDLAGTTLDGETGFMIGAEGRPKATTGLAFAGDYLSEDLFGVDRTRLRAGFGVGHFFGNERGHYAALLVGAVRDDLDIDDDAGWMVQARYEYSPTGPVSIGGNLTYADVWDGGASLDIYTRVHLSKYFAVQVGFTTDVIDEIEGDDRFYAGFRLSHDWL